jgi:hypothetical protein
MSGAGAGTAWCILTNSENNNELVTLCDSDRVTRNALQEVLETALDDWDRTVSDVNEGLSALQRKYEADSTIPSIERCSGFTLCCPEISRHLRT